MNINSIKPCNVTGSPAIINKRYTILAVPLKSWFLGTAVLRVNIKTII